MTTPIRVKGYPMSLVRYLMALNEGAVVRADGHDRPAWVRPLRGNSFTATAKTVREADRRKLTRAEFGVDCLLHIGLSDAGRRACVEIAQLLAEATAHLQGEK